MSQNDMTIADAAGAAFLADLNSAIGALVSNSSGATEPATMYAYQLWADTTSGWLKQRNAANSAWIKRFPLGTAARTDIASAATLDLDGNSATSDYLRVTGTTTTTAITLADGQRRFLIANAAWPITHGASLICPGSTSYTCAAGDLVLAIGEPAGVVRLLIFKADGTAVVGSGSVLRSFIAGLCMSTAGSSATMSIAAGQAADSTNAKMLSIAAFTKTTSAFSAGTGNGGLDTGSIANSTWYHFYLIAKSDGTAADITFSANASTPTLSGVYAGGLYRRIGSGKTNGSAQWVKFTQVGGEFYLDTPAAADFNGAGSATAANLTCNVPTGLKVKTFLNLFLQGGAGGTDAMYLSDPDNADVAPSVSATPFGAIGINGAASQQVGGQGTCWTNTSAQIRHRESNTNTVAIQVLGWFDPRGTNI